MGFGSIPVRRPLYCLLSHRCPGLSCPIGSLFLSAASKVVVYPRVPVSRIPWICNSDPRMMAWVAGARENARLGANVP